jgi:tetratricopeptide (TPR) repeat protein
MFATQKETEELLQSDSLYYHSQINIIIQQTQPKVDRIVKWHLAFHLFFILFGFVEATLLTIFFAYLAQSFLLAFSLSGMVLTLFSYFILRLYLKSAKISQFKKVKSSFSAICKQLIHYQEGVAEHHIILSNALSKWATALQNWEYTYFKPPKWLDFLAPTMERWSFYCFFEDVLAMRELLLKAAIEEHIHLVKCEPTSLDIHAALANAYIMLSGIYRKNSSDEEARWFSSQRKSEEMEKKFRETAERAIEEFKILSDYAPDDAWVHLQLAYSYHDLQMPEEEMSAYETILTLRPNDHETLFKLGILYFQQGYNAKGLRIYEKLKLTHYLQAENLIEYYGIYQ